METESAAQEELVSKRKHNGLIIWRWFGFKVSDDKQQNVFCIECRKLVSTKGSSTTNLFHHLQQHHKVQYKECVNVRAQATKPPQPSAPKQTLLQASFALGVASRRTSDQWRDITKAVAFHLAKDMAPISTVEQTGFVPLLKTLNPRYQLPSCNYFAREALPKMYTDVRTFWPACKSVILCAVSWKFSFER